MLWEPLKFSSYTFGSAKAQTLQEEVDKMLQKGALELVKHLGPGYYSRLFLVQKALRGWHPMIDLSNEWICHPYQIQDGGSVFGDGVDQERGLRVLD